MQPTPDNIEWFLKTGSMYGLGFVAIAGFLFIAFYGAWYGTRAVIALIEDVRKTWLPRLISGHLTFLETTTVTNAKTSEAVEKLSESYSASSDNHGKTHRALGKLSEAAKVHTTNADAKRLIDEALDELKGET